MSRIACFSLVVLALTAPGCTLLTNGNQYVGNGVDAGPLPDTGPRPDSSVDSAVDVGPHVNSPPVLGSLGLDNYEPVIGETIRAIAGRVVDPDGDATTLHYQWYVNGTERAGATTATLDSTALTTGDLVHVEAWVNDSIVDSARLQTNDVPVLADVTRWRQLLPSDDGRLPLMVWDAPNHRAVRIQDGGVWEYTLEGSNLRVTHLPTTGTPSSTPSDNAIVLFDEARRRMIVYTAGATDLDVLDITNRGGLTWSTISPSGTGPSDLLLASSFYDPASRRIFVIGGKDDTLGALDAFFALDVSSAGGESWATVTAAGFPRMFGAAVAPDRTTPGRFYLLGGLTSTVGTATVDAVYTGLDHVLQLDITATAAVTVTVRSGTQTPRWGGLGGSTDTGHVVVYGGFDTFGPTAGGVAPEIYDIASDAYSPLPGTAPHAALFGTMAEDPMSPGHFTALTLGAGLLTGDGASLQYDDVTEAGVTMVAVRNAPPSVVDAVARYENNVIQIFGGQSGGAVATSSWSLDTRSRQWSTLTPGEDGATHTQPDLRYGVVGDTSSLLGHPHLFVVGGARAAGVLTDMVAFQLRDTAWIEHTASGAPPPPRVGHVVTTGVCGMTELMIYGGEDATGNVLGDGASLNCSVDHACTWNTASIDGGRSYAALFGFMSTTFIFGGRTPLGPTNEVIALSQCFGSAPSSVIHTSNGPPPSPRYASTMVAIPDATGTFVTGISFGGTDGTLSFNDVASYAVDATGSSGTWSTLSPEGIAPAPRAHHVAMYDPAGRRMLVVGGEARSATRSFDGNDVWELLIRP